MDQHLMQSSIKRQQKMCFVGTTVLRFDYIVPSRDHIWVEKANSLENVQIYTLCV